MAVYGTTRFGGFESNLGTVFGTGGTTATTLVDFGDKRRHPQSQSNDGLGGGERWQSAARPELDSSGHARRRGDFDHDADLRLCDSR